MLKYYTVFAFLLVLPQLLIAQKTIGGTSKVFNLNLVPEYIKGKPVQLEANLSLIEENSNGIIDEEEQAKLHLTLRNTGEGIAQGVNFQWGSIPTKNFKVDSLPELFFLHPGDKVEYVVNVKPSNINNYSSTGELVLKINDHFTENICTTQIGFKPIYKRGIPPNLFLNLNFTDDNNNGIIESEENAMLELSLENRGSGPAQEIQIFIEDEIQDDNFLIGSVKTIPFLEAGERMNFSIPVKAVKGVNTERHKLNIHVKEHFGYDLDPVVLRVNTLEHQEPNLSFAGFEIIDHGEEVGIAPIHQDGQLQAGELAKIKIIIQNLGLGDANNVSFKLRSTNPDIYVENISIDSHTIGSGELKEFYAFISPNRRVKSDSILPLFVDVIEDQNVGCIKDFNIPVRLDYVPTSVVVHDVDAKFDEFKNHIARFEYSSKKFTTNIGVIHNIDEVKPINNRRANSVAVVFGIEMYKNIVPAPYANNDAEIIKRYFSERLGIEQVVMFLDQEASGFVFDDIFNPDYGELQKSIVKGETELFVFYSGHGIPSKDGNDVFLFPSDGKVENVESRGYNINELYTSLEKLGAKSTTVFIDACFSGSSRSTEKISMENLVATKGISISPKVKKPWEKNTSFSVFTSSGLGQTSLGFDPTQTGLFTYYLCAGLNGLADSNMDRRITHEELSSYLEKNVSETSKKIYGLQTPEFHGDRETVIVEY